MKGRDTRTGKSAATILGLLKLQPGNKNGMVISYEVREGASLPWMHYRDIGALGAIHEGLFGSR